MVDLTKQALVDLAEAKLADAKLLLRSGRFGSAFYLAGYTVELMLKAVLASEIRAETIPSRELMRDIFTHDIEKLARLARLDTALREKADADPRFAASWQIARAWNEHSRYDTRDAAEATILIEAIEHPGFGVLQWLRAQL